MEGSETPIQPGRAAASGGGGAGAFQGTVTGVKREGDVQTVEIQGAQGRIKLQAEGEFQVGEKVRVLTGQAGGVRLEKAALPAPAQGDWKGVSYTLGNLVTLRGLRAFEENLVRWVAGRSPGQPAAAGKGGPAGADLEALLRLPLPELLKRVLSREGGRETLAQALAGLGREAFGALMDGLEDGGAAGGPADTGKASVLQLLRALRREAEDPQSEARPGQGSAGSAGAPASGARAGGAARDLGAFWPPRPAGAGVGAPATAPQAWMGRVLTREDPGLALSFAGGKPLNLPRGAGGETPPLYRYLLDLGGRTLAVQSPQLRQPGDFVDFEMEAPAAGMPGASHAAHGSRLQARFLDPAETLPPGLRTAFAAADPQGKAALQVAARTLAEFQGEPYHDDLVKDFAAVLAQGGRLDPAAGGGLRAGQLPGRQELDTLLRLFVAFPRDSEAPERQAKVWTEAARDPKALQDLMRALSVRPEGETSLLRAGTPLRLAFPPGQGGGPALPADLAAALLGAAEDKPEEALAALLRRALPEGFKAPELADLARQASPPGADGKDAQAARLLAQAFAGLVPREDELREGRPAQFYFYHGQDWRGLQVTWERDRDRGQDRKRDPDAPIKVRVETTAQHMGKVDVGVVVRKDQATLDFRNQFHDVRELLAAELPELEKSLALLGYRIEGWTYGPLEEAPIVLPTAGWVRPASLDGGNLDLTG